MTTTSLLNLTVLEFENYLKKFTIEEIMKCGRRTRHNKPLARLLDLHGFLMYSGRVRKKNNKYGVTSITLGWPQVFKNYISIYINFPGQMPNLFIKLDQNLEVLYMGEENRIQFNGYKIDKTMKLYQFIPYK